MTVLLRQPSVADVIELTVLDSALQTNGARVWRLPNCVNFSCRTWTLSCRVAHHVCDEFRGVPTLTTVMQYLTVQCESVQVCVARFAITRLDFNSPFTLEGGWRGSQRRPKAQKPTAAADVTPWRAMAEAVVRGYPRDEIIQHHAQLQQLLVDMAARSSGGKSASGRYRAYDSAQLLYSTAVAFPTRQFGTRIDAEDWRLSIPPPSRAATRRDTLRRSQHR